MPLTTLWWQGVVQVAEFMVAAVEQGVCCKEICLLQLAQALL